MPVQRCLVSFVDLDGFRHAVEVQATTLYEACVLAVRAFREHGCEPKSASMLDIEVSSPVVKHTVAWTRVHAWLEVARSPAERLAKDRLKALLK